MWTNPIKKICSISQTTEFQMLLPAITDIRLAGCLKVLSRRRKKNYFHRWSILILFFPWNLNMRETFHLVNISFPSSYFSVVHSSQPLLWYLQDEKCNNKRLPVSGQQDVKYWWATFTLLSEERLSVVKYLYSLYFCLSGSCHTDLPLLGGVNHCPNLYDSGNLYSLDLCTTTLLFNASNPEIPKLRETCPGGTWAKLRNGEPFSLHFHKTCHTHAKL